MGLEEKEQLGCVFSSTRIGQAPLLWGPRGAQPRGIRVHLHSNLSVARGPLLWTARSPGSWRWTSERADVLEDLGGGQALASAVFPPLLGIQGHLGLLIPSARGIGTGSFTQPTQTCCWIWALPAFLGGEVLLPGLCAVWALPASLSPQGPRPSPIHHLSDFSRVSGSLAALSPFANQE